MLKAVVVALALVLVSAANAQQLSQSVAPSQPPHPAVGPESGAEQKPPANRQEQSQSDQRGTEKSPLIVKMRDTPKSQSEAEQDADYQERITADQRIFEVGVWAIIVGFLQTIALVVTFLVIAYVAINQLRAYVYGDIRGLKKFSLTEPIQVSIVWKNCGQTPARGFESHGYVWIAELPMPDGTDFDKTSRPSEPPGVGRHSKTTIFPGTEARSVWDSLGKGPIPKEVIECLAAGKFAFYAIGQAFYRDIFHIRRKTQVCHYIEPSDAFLLIEAEQKNLPLDIEVRFSATHILNEFR